MQRIRVSQRPVGKAGRRALLLIVASSFLVVSALYSLSKAADAQQIADYRFSKAEYFVNENDGLVTLTIEQNQGDHYWYVRWRTVDGTAAAGVDYLAKEGKYEWQREWASQSFSIPILNDPEVESEEFFTVELARADEVPYAKAKVTITNEDQPQDSPQSMQPPSAPAGGAAPSSGPG